MNEHFSNMHFKPMLASLMTAELSPGEEANCCTVINGEVYVLILKHLSEEEAMKLKELA